MSSSQVVNRADLIWMLMLAVNIYEGADSEHRCLFKYGFECGTN